MLTVPFWYWLSTVDLAWVRKNIPCASIEKHRSIMSFRPGAKEMRNALAVCLTPTQVAKLRKAGIKPEPVLVQTTCAACGRKCIPFFEYDPCIADLPSVAHGHCGHEEWRGYVEHENSNVIRFPSAIERYPSDGNV